MSDGAKVLWKRIVREDGSFYDIVGSFNPSGVNSALSDGWKEKLDEPDQDEERKQQPPDRPKQSGEPGEQQQGHDERGGEAQLSVPPEQSVQDGGKEPVRDQPDGGAARSSGKRRG